MSRQSPGHARTTLGLLREAERAGTAEAGRAEAEAKEYVDEGLLEPEEAAEVLER